MTTKKNKKEKDNTQKINVGIDVGKSQLDFFLHEKQIHFSVENNPKGIRLALARLKPFQIERILLEASGGYEHAFVEAAIDHDLPVIIANPLSVRRFAQALGTLAKTDQIDAALIAKFSATLKPDVRKHNSKIIMKINDFTGASTTNH